MSERIVVDSKFRKELEGLLNRYSIEAGSNTPDFILADYLCGCLAYFNIAVTRREEWYGRDPNVGPAGIRTDRVGVIE